jgi:uncharacterized protein (TIGR00730 family)
LNIVRCRQGNTAHWWAQPDFVGLAELKDCVYLDWLACRGKLEWKEVAVRSLCVFCGSSFGHDRKWRDAARRLGSGLAASGITLVYGGSRSGLMGQVAEAALEAGGRVEGVIPRFFLPNEDPFAEVSELTVVEDMHTRKKLMFDKSDGFCVLPGGLGTLDETFEILTWKQIHLHDKPVLLVDMDGYWSSWLTLVDKVVAEGFAKPGVKEFYEVVPSVEAALERVKTLTASPRPADSSKV